MNKVAIIIPFYAIRLPSYFKYWLWSLKNKNFDVLFVSDLEIADNECVPNFKKISMTFAQLRVFFQKKLQLEIALKNPHKLCDLRPFYGFVFEEYLKQYNYWGYGDCDLVYGNKLNQFVSSCVSLGYDAFGITEHWMSGCFSVYKNDTRFRVLYKKANNWREVLQSSENRLFDELGGNVYDEIWKGILTEQECFEKIDSWTKLVFSETDCRVFHPALNCEMSLLDGTLVFMRENGSLFSGERELELFHYVLARKKRYFVIPNTHQENIRGFHIDKFGIYNSDLKWRIRQILHIIRWVKTETSYLFGHGKAIIRRIKRML